MTKADDRGRGRTGALLWRAWTWPVRNRGTKLAGLSRSESDRLGHATVVRHRLTPC